MRWDSNKRPPPNICPERYCFFWMPLGGKAHSGHEVIHFPTGGCSCPLGVCSRLPNHKGEHDYYEPSQLELDADGLPHTYFMTDAKDG